MSQSIYIVACGIILAILILRYVTRGPGHGSNDFPGPTPAPFLGNIKDFPKGDWLECFNAWREKYGDVVSMSTPQFHILVLSSLDDAKEFLGRRTDLSSGRPENFVANNLWNVLQMPLGHNFNEIHKLFKRFIGPQSVLEYDRLIEQEASNFVQRISGFTGDPLEMIQDSVGAVIIKISYGEEAYRTHGTELVRLATATLELMSWALIQIWIVNFVPIARFPMQWLPGLKFSRVVKKGRDLNTKLLHWPFSLVKDAVDRGNADFSMVSKHLNEPGVDNSILRNVSATMYFGGVDTTTNVLLAFFGMMVMHPKVQRKIQAELDEVFGDRNPPTTSAVLSMTYLSAAWRENLRLNPPVPTSIPHVTTGVDSWKGRIIPKRTVIFCNIWYMLRDPRLWGEDANEFKPERLLAEYNPRVDELPDVSCAFGFGRRKCPGRYLAERTGMVYAAAVLSTYDIVSSGVSIPTSLEFSTTQIRRPTNVLCQFVPRK